MFSTSTEATMTTNVATSINDLPDELLRLISISGGPTEYCNFRRSMKRVWLTTTGREDHCIKHFLVTIGDHRGATKTTLCGKLHSMFDQPTWIGSNGTKCWYQHGKRHRDNDLPAIIFYNGEKRWYQYNELHRDNDLPAWIWGSGMQWYQHGKHHRNNDLPAVIYVDGKKMWYKHGERYFP